ASSRLIWGWLLHVHLKRYDEAEAAYRKAIDLDPKFVEPWSNLGLLLSDHLERHEEAEAAYRKAIDIDPKFPGPWNNLGLLLTEHFDRHEDAEAVYRKAIEFDPKHASPWINLAHLLTRQFKRHEDAENAYRKALDLAPKDAGVWSNLGYLLTNQLERHEEAEAAFRKAIDLDPKLPNSKSALSNLLATQRNGDPAEIRELAVQGLELGAHNSYCRWVFHEQCWTHADSLKEVLPPFGNWLVEQSGGDDEDEAHAFAIEMWLQLARLTTPAAAGQLLAEQPEEARLAFEILQDAFIAADDEQHLHLLAPERRAPVMKLLEKLES
ncbi:MAG: tetratricopeptide repeat protein, partial [Verrucomicrobiota bacterium]